MRTIAVGDNCIDVYGGLGRFYVTGNAVDFAINLRRLGGEVAVLTLLGDDLFGALAGEALEAEGLDCSRVRRGAAPSPMARMRLDGADRVHEAYYENVLSGFSLSPEDLDYIRRFDIVYSEESSRFERYIGALEGGGRRFVHDYNRRYRELTEGALLPHLDYAFFSYAGDGPALRALMESARARSGAVLVAMLGEEGSLALDGAGWRRQPALPAALVNTAGAGDSYIAGFVRGLCDGETVPACMRRGAERAARVIGRFEPY